MYIDYVYNRGMKLIATHLALFILLLYIRLVPDNDYNGDKAMDCIHRMIFIFTDTLYDSILYVFYIS